MTRFSRRTLILSGSFALHLLTPDLVSAQDQFFDSNGVRIRGSADANLAAMQQLTSVLPTFTVVVIEGTTHGEALGVTRRPEFVDNVHTFTAAHKEASSSR
jgi:hypothetical protein